MNFKSFLGYSSTEGVGDINDTVTLVYVAGSAMTVGDAVRLGTLTTSEGKSYVPVINTAAAAGTDHTYQGQFTGYGRLTGAVDATSGRRNALTGDIVEICKHGIADANLDATAAIAVNDALSMDTGTAGELIAAGTTFTAGLLVGVIALEALAAGTGRKKVYVQSM